MKYSGKCQGGPRDGAEVVHWCDELPVYRPMMDAFAFLTAQHRAEIEIMLAGTYKHDAALGIWRWERA